MKKLKNVKAGEYFTLKPIPEPEESIDILGITFFGDRED